MHAAKFLAALALLVPAIVAASSPSEESETLELYRRAALTHNAHIRRRVGHAKRLADRVIPANAEADEAAAVYAAALPKRSVAKNSKRCAPKSTSSSSAPAASNTSKASTNLVTGLINIVTPSKSCADSGAVKKTVDKAGPNGSIDWINCGIDGDGWSPPNATVDDLVMMDYDTAMSSNVFAPCKKYKDIFTQAGQKYSIPPLLLASFANQESSCDAGSGDGGLMQITSDKCGDAPNGDCNDPTYNIMTGAKFFAQTLKDKGGNVFYALGYYNGWDKGMTKKQAMTWLDGNCNEQRNLDYVHQIVNGWLQGVSAYANNPNLRVFNNVQC